MTKTFTLIALAFFCVQQNGYSQKNRSWELEGSVIVSNRIISVSGVDNFGTNSYNKEKANAHSKILPGGYLQAGINFRHDKRLRLFTGLRLMNQQVILLSTSQSPNASSDISPSSLSVGSLRTDMVYVNIPVSLKYDLVQKPNFRLTTELGLLPGMLVLKSASKKMDGSFLNLSSEISLVFEKKLKKGNSIAFRFPCFNYALTPNFTVGQLGKRMSQNNYSLGLGIKFVFPRSK
jgi:hypothetical protein